MFQKMLVVDGITEPVQLMQLRRMMDFAMRSSYKSLKQTNMLEHFRHL